MTKTAFITITGRTNAGKSTLLNSLIGEKIASVSDKPQTTRTRITGILTIEETQLVFIDTPGLHKAKTKLGEHMMKSVKDSISGIDAIIFVTDCTRKIGEQEIEMLESLNKSGLPVILILNKIDLLPSKEQLASTIQELTDKYNFHSVIPISAKENDGVNIVLEEAKKLANESPLYFPANMITDQPERVIAGEIIREQLLHLLSEEVPHGIAVSVEEMKERDDKDLLDISAVIYCERDSHKGIIIGKGGKMLKLVGQKARTQLEEFFQIKVNLQLWVKVKENWRNREGLIKSFGLAEN
jgi:GTP-binding protein Era